jgi:DNA-binding transcriptional LysR family regulator
VNVELRHLRYFIALAEARSFGRAAIALGIAQPALSQQIRKLEDELDVVLFRRGNHGTHLTPAGEAFLPGARVALADAADAVATARRAGRSESGHLTVGFVGSAALELIPAALRVFRKFNPGVEISLAEMELTQMAERFERGGLDVAFLRRPVDDRTLSTEPVRIDEMVAVMPDDHPLCHEESIPLSALATEDWVITPSSVSRAKREIFFADCGCSGFEPAVGAEAFSAEAVVGLVASGAGVAMLPKGSNSLRCEGVCSVPIQNQESVMVMAWREDRRTPAITAFMRLTREIAPRACPPSLDRVGV